MTGNHSAFWGLIEMQSDYSQRAQLNEITKTSS